MRTRRLYCFQIEVQDSEENVLTQLVYYVQMMGNSRIRKEHLQLVDDRCFDVLKRLYLDAIKIYVCTNILRTSSFFFSLDCKVCIYSSIILITLWSITLFWSKKVAENFRAYKCSRKFMNSNLLLNGHDILLDLTGRDTNRKKDILHISYAFVRLGRFCLHG